MQTKQRREREKRLAPEHRAAPLEKGDEGGEQTALILSRECRSSPCAQVHQAAVEQIKARLLHLRGRIPQTVD